MSARDGMQLTAEAQELRTAFERQFGDRGNCSCHLSPPCGSCVHPGNPANQFEDDSAWEPIPVEPPAPSTNDVSPEKRAALLAAISAAFDELVADNFQNDMNAIYEATKDQRSELGLSILYLAMRFVDNTREAHPEFAESYVRRCAADSVARALLLIARSARRLEGSDLSPGRAGVATYFIAEQLIEIEAELAAKGTKL